MVLVRFTTPPSPLAAEKPPSCELAADPAVIVVEEPGTKEMFVLGAEVLEPALPVAELADPLPTVN